MDIKKADSKGRVSGFEPGELYVVDRNKGYFSKVIFKTADTSFLDESTERFKDVAKEEIDQLLEEARKNVGFGAIADLRDYVPAPAPPHPVKNGGMGVGRR